VLDSSPSFMSGGAMCQKHARIKNETPIKSTY
jgi:hypothetical protein